MGQADLICMSDFEQELKAGFLDEVTQLLEDAEQCFLALEDDPQNSANLEKIFRIAHNVKGSSKAVGFDELGAFTHEFETFLLKCKSGQMVINKATISLLLACNDHLHLSIDRLKVDHSAVTDSRQLIAELHDFDPNTAVPVASAETPAATENTDDSFSSVEVELLQKAPEDFGEVNATELAPAPEVRIEASVEAPDPLLAAKDIPPSKVVPVKPAAASPSADESIRVSLSRLERLLNFVGEMVILQTVLKEQSLGQDPLLFHRTIQQMGKVTKEVQDLSMSLRMVPLKQTFQKMQRIVRDTASLLEKQVNLVLEGEETEVDKTILEALSDPLVHLVRNAVDHGIEMPAARQAAGKDPTGSVSLKAFHQSGKLIIEVSDNGNGIPADRLRAKALERGIIKPGQVLSDQEAVELVFHPGFSMKAQVTEVSGRGVGMDVVKTNIEKMQGEVLIETQPGVGSVFRIVLPLTMAIIDGMVVRCEGERFIIPRSHVHESIKLSEKDMQFAAGTGEVLFLRGENLPLIRLARCLGRKTTRLAPGTHQIAIIVRSQGKPFAVVVDEIIGQHQVVIKKLGEELQNVKGFSGSAILGDGRPALILELGDLLSTSSAKKVG